MSEIEAYEKLKNLIKSQSIKVFTIYELPVGTMLELNGDPWIITNKIGREVSSDPFKSNTVMDWHTVEIFCIKLSIYQSLSYRDLMKAFTQNTAKILHVPETNKECLP